MRAVFLDTVGLLALFDVRDQWHPAAEAAWDLEVAEGTPVLTTPLVLVECANAAARRPPLRAAVANLRETLTAVNAVIEPLGREWDAAWQSYARGEAGEASVVDHVSFLVMRRHGLRRAFTNDRHFAAAGFETLF